MTDRVSASDPADLALFTGVSAFDEVVRVGRPNVVAPEQTLARISSALDARWLTNNGALVKEFEARLADYLDVPHVIATTNATVALELLVHTLALSGDVIVPSWTFVADAHALHWTGVTPRFCDVDPVTHCLDPVQVEAAITPETTAILGVHLWGHPCDIEALQSVADRHDLDLIFDAAHAFGCRVGGEPIGRFGRAEVFSFHATKVLTSFEGGAITTTDDDLAARLRLARNFGFDNEDEVIVVGTNAKMNEACAAMGLTSLEQVDDLLARNRENFAAYEQGLGDIPGIELLVVGASADSNRHYVVVDVDATTAGLSRDEIVTMLRLENVEARRYFHPGCHRLQPYRTTDPLARGRLPVTEQLSPRVMVLPTGLAVTPDIALRISSLIARAVVRAPEVSAALRTVQDERLPSFWR